MTYADCEGCTRCTSTEEGYYCEWNMSELGRVNYCELQYEELESCNERNS